MHIHITAIACAVPNISLKRAKGSVEIFPNKNIHLNAFGGMDPMRVGERERAHVYD